MAIKTRQTDGTGVTNENAPLTNEELDNNFIELVAEDALKADLSGADFTGQVTISTTTENALDILAGTNNQRLLRLSHPTAPSDAGGYFDFNSDGTTDNNVVTFGVEYSGTDYDVLNIQRSTQRVGIGTILPITNLDIIGANDTTFDTPYTILLQGTDAYNSGNAGSGIVFAGEYNSSEERTAFATISGVKENTTDGNFTGALLFGTRKSSGLNIESMRLTSGGNLGIGTISPNGITEIASSATGDVLGLQLSNSAGAGSDSVSLRFRNSTVSTSSSGGSELTGLRDATGNGGSLIAKTSSSAGTMTERLTIDSSGNVGINDSTPSYRLDVDGDGRFTSTVYAGVSATTGGMAFAQNYNGSDILGNLSSLRSTGAFVFGYGVTGDGSTANQYNSSYDNFNGGHSAVTVNQEVIQFLNDSSDSQTTVGALVPNFGVRAQIDRDGLKIQSRLLNSHGARLHNEPASGLRGTGMNMTDLGAIDTGKNTPDAGCRGMVWTGKYYISVNYTANSNKGRFHRYDSNLNLANWKSGNNYLDHNETDLFYPHGAAWDGRYLAFFGRATLSSSTYYLNIFDVDNLTSGYATRIAKIDVSPITGNVSMAGLGYAEGLYWIRFGTRLVGFEIDLASQTATAVIDIANVGYTLSAQGITYDGSHLYITQNGAAMYKHSLDGALVASTATGIIPNCTALTWNGQEFIGVKYDTGDIYAIPVTHKSYSDYQSQGQMIVGYGSNDPLLDSAWTYPDVLIGGFPSGNHDDADGHGGYKFGVISDLDNGGNSPTMRKNQVWITGGVSGEAYNSFAAWDVGRWGNFGVDARSRLDLYLGDNTADRSHTMTWLYDEDRPRVGINTTNPDTMLEIYNPNAGSSNELYEPALKVSTNVSSVDSYIGISPSQIRYRRQTATAVPLRIQTYVRIGSAGGGDITFEPNNTTTDYTPVEAMRIQKGGNVGINQDSPSRKLHVVATDWNNASGAGVLIDNNNTVGSGITLRPTGSAVDTSGWAMYAGGPGAAIGDGNWGLWAHTTNQARLVVQRGGNVGIGTNSPSSPLTISHTNLSAEPYSGLKIINTNAASGAAYTGVYVDAPLQSHIRLATAGSLKWQMRTGTTTSGQLRFYSWDSAADVFTLDSNGNATLSGELTVNSDERIKDNIEQIDGALEKVQAIRGVTFNRTDTDDDTRHAGVIAQEVEKVLPEVVKDGEDGIKSVAYANMVGLLIEAIKEQQTQIDDLKAEVTRLKGFE